MKLSRHPLKHIYEGIGTVIELLPKQRSLKRRYQPADTPANALQGDWYRVGDHLSWALVEHRTSVKLEKKNCEDNS
jgi:hypothetical protein